LSGAESDALTRGQIYLKFFT